MTAFLAGAPLAIMLAVAWAWYTERRSRRQRRQLRQWHHDNMAPEEIPRYYR